MNTATPPMPTVLKLPISFNRSRVCCTFRSCAPLNVEDILQGCRKESGLTQQQIADKVGMHVSQYKRYEAGTSQPTIEVFRRIALALSVSADTLLFEESERGPDERLKLQFEAVSRLDPKEREAIETVIAGVLHMHDAKRWAQLAAAPSTPAPTQTSSKRSR
ncbi:helix-turn-helix domain-containing protein [Caballeronia calidae]|uniref:helix-turn-helix domain-containing protein n=1 Tax=Caballeronia calidae TaxID=1777139 RepID=UPI0018E05DB3|nr:helix-turn-helix transcriptional regulator [Caballeronia calidae]